MHKKSIMFLILFSTISFTNIVKGNSFDLTLDIMCPSRIHLGEPFNFQVTIHNNSTTTSHNYTLSWEIDGNKNSLIVKTGELPPNQTVTLTSSYLSFIHPGVHGITFNLLEDGEATYWNITFIEVKKIEATFIYSLNPLPIYPDTSFNLILELKNEGDDTIYKVSGRILPVKGTKGRIEPIASPFFYLGNISSKSSSSSNFTFNVPGDVSTGLYNIPVYVYFWDSRGMFYEKYYYITVEISSRETVDKLEILESIFEVSFQELREIINVLQHNMILITALTMLIIAVASLTNYWYSKRLARCRSTSTKNPKL